MNEEDFAAASLAALVGAELKTIDKFTDTIKNSPAARINPRDFIDKKVNSTKRNATVAHHEGKIFHAGIDESYVQSMYPDPVPSLPAVAEQPKQQVAELTSNVPKSVVPSAQHLQSQSSSAHLVEYNDTLIKILQSIDKTLKSIDKSEKALTKAVNILTQSQQATNTKGD